MEQLLQDSLDIREVVRRTGLTSSALRFYESRGLVKPLRTYSVRRLYGSGELERIQQILALKRAGLTLSQIAKLTARRPLDLRQLVGAQLKLIEERKTELDEARSLLLSIKSRIDRGEPVDAATFCSLIRHGDKIMEAEKWKEILSRYVSKEEQAHCAGHSPPESFDQVECSHKWVELGKRVEASIPLGHGSAKAQALYDEWQGAPRALQGDGDARHARPRWPPSSPAGKVDSRWARFGRAHANLRPLPL